MTQQNNNNKSNMPFGGAPKAFSRPWMSRSMANPLAGPNNNPQVRFAPSLPTQSSVENEHSSRPTPAPRYEHSVGGHAMLPPSQGMPWSAMPASQPASSLAFGATIPWSQQAADTVGPEVSNAVSGEPMRKMGRGGVPYSQPSQTAARLLNEISAKSSLPLPENDNLKQLGQQVDNLHKKQDQLKEALDTLTQLHTDKSSSHNSTQAQLLSLLEAVATRSAAMENKLHSLSTAAAADNGASAQLPPPPRRPILADAVTQTSPLPSGSCARPLLAPAGGGGVNNNTDTIVAMNVNNNTKVGGSDKGSKRRRQHTISSEQEVENEHRSLQQQGWKKVKRDVSCGSKQGFVNNVNTVQPATVGEEKASAAAAAAYGNAGGGSLLSGLVKRRKAANSPSTSRNNASSGGSAIKSSSPHAISHGGGGGDGTGNGSAKPISRGLAGLFNAAAGAPKPLISNAASDACEEEEEEEEEEEDQGVIARQIRRRLKRHQQRMRSQPPAV